MRIIRCSNNIDRYFIFKYNWHKPQRCSKVNSPKNITLFLSKSITEHHLKNIHIFISSFLFTSHMFSTSQFVLSNNMSIFPYSHYNYLTDTISYLTPYKSYTFSFLQGFYICFSLIGSHTFHYHLHYFPAIFLKPLI